MDTRFSPFPREGAEILTSRWNCLAPSSSWSQKLDFEGLTRAGCVLPETVGNRKTKYKTWEREGCQPGNWNSNAKAEVRGKNQFVIQLPNRNLTARDFSQRIQSPLHTHPKDMETSFKKESRVPSWRYIEIRSHQVSCHIYVYCLDLEVLWKV